MAGPGRVFLMYHELEQHGRPLCQSEPGYARYVITADNFRSQMRFLQQTGWRGLSVTEAFSSSASDAVVITFDDGCETDLLIAAPVLKDAGFGATFYITAGFVGKPGYLSPNQLRELGDSGFDIGCHSMTHPYLIDIDEAGLQREIVVAKEKLEQMTGGRVAHFSCPGGHCDRRVVQIAKQAGYRSVATSHAQVNTETTDPFALGRVAIKRGTELEAFQRICRGQGLRKLRLIHLARLTARRLMGNSRYDALRTSLMGPGPGRDVRKPGT